MDATELAAGDPRRAPVGRAVGEVLAVAWLFLGYTWLTKGGGPLYARVPWADDPFDAVVSFALILLPFLGLLTGARLLLCRRGEPLPRSRLDGLVHAAIVLLAIVLATIVSDWSSVLVHPDLADRDPVTAAELAFLAVATAAAVVSMVHLRRATGDLPRPARHAVGPDWLDDGLLLADRWSRRLGPASGPAAALVGQLGSEPSRWVRRRPIASAALVATAIGLVVMAGMALEEGLAPVLLVIFGVVTCGLFAFIVAIGAYLGLIRAERPLAGVRRRLVDGLVLAAAAVPFALAFRDRLWWIVGGEDRN